MRAGVTRPFWYQLYMVRDRGLLAEMLAQAAETGTARQLDVVLSTAEALPPTAAAVGDRMTILADGRVRSGLDVVRLLALGAKGVLLGRAWAFALAGAGQAGVAHVLELIRAEMTVAMALTGATKVSDLTPEVLASAAQPQRRVKATQSSL